MGFPIVEPPAVPRIAMSFDIVGSTSGGNVRHWRQLATMRLALDQAIARCRLTTGENRGWVRRPDGDSELVLAPPGLPKAAVLSELLPAVRTALLRLNYSQKPEFQVRLRVGVDHGDVTFLHGLPAGGEVLAVVVTLRDAEALRVAMHDNPAAVLGVAVTEDFHRAAVRYGDPVLHQDDFRRVLVRGKYADLSAWIHLVGVCAIAQPAVAQPSVSAPRWRLDRRGRYDRRRTGRRTTLDRAPGGRPRGATAPDPGPDHTRPALDRD